MYKSVLVPLDIHDPENCAQILEQLPHLCAGAETKVQLLTVLPQDESLGWAKQFVPEGFVDGLIEDATNLLENMAQSLRDLDIVSCVMVTSGNTYVETLRIAEQQRADLIVIGSGRDELKDFLLGPSAARIVRHADCSVLVVRS
jgi:nucleotide-binding universal stress UspA family protein